MGKRNMPGGMGKMGGMMKKVQKMQKEVAKVQKELEEKEVEATAGGGVIKAIVNGKKELMSLDIDPEAMDPDDVEMTQDLIIAAVNEAINKAEKMMEEGMAKVTGGMNIPGL